MKKLLLIILFFISCFSIAYGNSLAQFNNESEAQMQCPTDEVVWVNLSSGIFHLKGKRWYPTKNGAYVCKEEALSYGYRESKNNQ